MSGFQYRTRGQKSPQGLQKVYFTAAGKDFDTYFEKYKDRILGIADCAVWFLPEDEEYEDIETDLGGMSLFVIPVTTKLLTTDNRTISKDLPFAEKKRIPVLPVMMESGLDELCARHFGDRHYLDPNKQDETAIGFEEKLKNYILSVIVGDELTAKVRKAFDAYIFLSYRKKDRRYAQELMRLIHKNEFCRDIAIWYDEILTPGEDFNNAIKKALKDSKLFTLVVTQSLLELNDLGLPNYVMSKEYPLAAGEDGEEWKTPILPVKMADVDDSDFEGKYPKAGAAVTPEALTDRLSELLDEIIGLANLANDNDPEHNFFIGLAYLGGIDVERDYEKALQLITFAAEHGVAEANKKLVDMYGSGEGVERNYLTAIEWQKKLAALYEKRAENEKNFDNCLDYLIALWDIGDKLAAVGDPEAAEPYYQQLYEKSAEYTEDEKRFKRHVSISLIKLGDIRKAQGDISGAEEYYSRSLEIAERLAEETNTVKARRDLSISLNRLGDIRAARGDLSGAEGYYARSLEIRERLADETKTVEAHDDLAVSYVKCAMLKETYNIELLKKAYGIYVRLAESCPCDERYRRLRDIIQNEIRKAQADRDPTPRTAKRVKKRRASSPVFSVKRRNDPAEQTSAA